MGQLVSFRIDGLPLALPLEQVQEVVGMPAITPLPTVDRRLLGVIDLRGVTCPVIDLRRLLGLAAVPIAPDQHLLMLHANDRVVGVAADRVEGVDVGEVEALPMQPATDGVIQGLARVNGDLRLVLDAGRLLDAEPLPGEAARTLTTTGRARSGMGEAA